MTNSVYIYVSLSVAILLLAIWILLIELRLKKIFRGNKSKNLEEILINLNNKLEKLNISREKTEKYLETVEKRLKKSIQNVGVLRFNPFKDSGSNQSFAIAFLDESGDGVVISSLYSREKVSIYAKPIKEFQSEYSLSKEEREAINKSKEND
ncbi:MAG: DUF4446 family protein [Patescibacteria group bacterium]